MGSPVLIQISLFFIIEKVLMAVAITLILVSVSFICSRFDRRVKSASGLLSNNEIRESHPVNRKYLSAGLLIMALSTLLISSVIPWGSHFEISGRKINLFVTDINEGLLFALSMLCLLIVGVFVAGFGSRENNRLTELFKTVPRLIFYVLVIALCIIPVVMITNTLSPQSVVDFQVNKNSWLFVYQPLGAVCFFISVLLMRRFIFPAGSSGHIEETNLLFVTLEYLFLTVAGALMATLYLGGYDIPFVDDKLFAQKAGANLTAMLQFIIIGVKSFIIMFLIQWANKRIGDRQYEKTLFPFAGILLVTAVVNLIGTNVFLVFFN